MAQFTDFLNWNVKIVDSNGYPTPEFLRFLQTNKSAINGNVPSSREINTGLGLTGGGDLSKDRTISLDASLDDLNDVDLSTPPTDTQVLTYVAADGKWEAQDPTGGGGGPAGEAAWKVDAVGTGVSQNITIPDNNPTKQSIIVSVNGVRYDTVNYSISGTVVTLTTNAAGDDIEIVGPVGDGKTAPFLVTATGTGASQTLTLPFGGLTPQTCLVYVNGVRQPISLYSISGSGLTLTTNASGDSIEIIGPLGAVVISGGGFLAKAFVGPDGAVIPTQAGTEAPIPGLSVTLTTTAGNYYVHFDIIVARPSGGVNRIILVVDGVQVVPSDGQFIRTFHTTNSGDSGSDGPVLYGSGGWVIPLTAASHTIEIYTSDGTSASTTVCFERSMYVQDFN